MASRYLLEHYGLADAEVLKPVRDMLTATYQRLDPEGAFLSRWRLQLNVTPEELDAVIRFIESIEARMKYATMPTSIAALDGDLQP